jgi:hypothetical protein
LGEAELNSLANKKVDHNEVSLFLLLLAVQPHTEPSTIVPHYYALRWEKGV